jgi:hypothetical protein
MGRTAHDARMSSHLDILLIERRPGLGAVSVDDLERAGHRVHRCYPAPGTRDDPATALAPMCTAVTDGTCPLDRRVDVALVARKGIAVRPSVTEHGVSCAIRAGVPLVEDGSDLFDPYGPWLTARVGPDGDTVTACEQAAQEGFAPLREAIRVRTRRALAAAHVAPDDVACRFDIDGTRLTVVLSGPPITRAARQALGVRVLDAVRAGRRTFGQVDVVYEERDVTGSAA